MKFALYRTVETEVEPDAGPRTVVHLSTALVDHLASVRDCRHRARREGAGHYEVYTRDGRRRARIEVIERVVYVPVPAAAAGAN